MAYQHFLEEFARAQGVESVDVLLSEYATRYSFQINSRTRAKAMIETLVDLTEIDFKGKKVLDIGCAYGSFSIELANLGAEVVGIDISDKWLKLAEANAIGEKNAQFYNCDASSRKALNILKDHAPFDVVIINDVLEHIYDTTGLLNNVSKLMADDGLLYFKVPNGMATRHVLMEGHKRTFGISILPPDYWQEFVKAPFHIYYRRWDYFKALFEHFGFDVTRILNKNHDEDIEKTRRHIVNDINKIRRHLKKENFETPAQFAYARRFCQLFFEEAQHDMETMPWQDLFFKYRVTFWEGLIQKQDRAKDFVFDVRD